MAPKSKSKSKSKSKASSSAAAAAGGPPGELKAGSKVEICSAEEGFRGSWFTGRIIRRQGPNGFLVEYDTLITEDKPPKLLKEHLEARQLRPMPPPDPNQEFKFGDEVDAFHNDGWWEGHITKELPNGMFTVYFRVSREQLHFTKDQLRLHREWINEGWVPPYEPQQQQQQQQQRQQDDDDKELKKTVEVTPRSHKKKTVEVTPPSHVKFAETLIEENGDFEYKAGALVEVSSDEEGFRGAWFAGSIVEAKGENRFIVEYETLADNDSKVLREEVDIHHVRPRPPKTAAVAKFSFLDEVDALENDCWWVGVVSKVLPNSRYIVYFRNSTEELQFKHSQLRPHQDFIDGKWVMVSKGLKF